MTISDYFLKFFIDHPIFTKSQSLGNQDMDEIGTILLFQAMCEWGRESIESWGRKRRSLPHNETNEVHNQEEDMNISQEILVLDFGDERQSTDFLRSDKPGGTASETNFGGKFCL